MPTLGRASSSPVGLPRPVTPPVKPEPFDMQKWRAEWGAFWPRANRAVIRAVIPKAG